MRKFQLPEGVFKVLRAVAQDKRFIAATEIAYEAVSKRVPLWRVNRDGWFIFPVHLLEEQGKTFTITLARARLAGRKPEDLI